MKIYTKTGDAGETSLYGGERRLKSNVRIAAYGEVDELQAVLGVCMALLGDPDSKDILDVLQEIQYDSFVVAAQLARTETKASRKDPVVAENRVTWLETQIDHYEAALPPLKAFIMQGGTLAGAHLHQARSVCRRSERVVVALAAQEAVDAEVIQYLNRLSDLLFVLARTINHRAGQPEVEWRA